MERVTGELQGTVVCCAVGPRRQPAGSGRLEERSVGGREELMTGETLKGVCQ